MNISWKLLPNIYTVLVARPGLGKGEAYNVALGFLKESQTANVLSDRLTIPYVLERMSKGFSGGIQGNAQGGQLNFVSESSALMGSPELSIFITNHDAFPTLADLWDAREGKMMYGTRQKGEWNIIDAQLSLLGCSSPEWLTKTIPVSAVAGGFTRRVNFVYSRKKRPVPPDKASLSNDYPIRRARLVNDLRRISTLSGEFSLDKEVIDGFNHLREADPDEFDDEATAGYVASKFANVAKLAMILSVSRDDSLHIDMRCFHDALNAINACERDLRLVFRAVGESDLASVGDKVLRFLESKGHATRRQILGAVWKDVTSSDLDMVLTTLTEGGMITYRNTGNSTLYFIVNIPPMAQGAKAGTP